MTTLRYVDPNRRRSRLTPVMAKLGTNRVANIISRRIGWKLDPILLSGSPEVDWRAPSSSPPQSSKPAAPEPARLAATPSSTSTTDRTGSSSPRRTPANPHNPSWYYNLRANPDVTIGGAPAHATDVEDPNEARLWQLADQVFPAFAEYRTRAAEDGRAIPLVTLTLDP